MASLRSWLLLLVICVGISALPTQATTYNVSVLSSLPSQAASVALYASKVINNEWQASGILDTLNLTLINTTNDALRTVNAAQGAALDSATLALLSMTPFDDYLVPTASFSGIPLLTPTLTQSAFATAGTPLFSMSPKIDFTAQAVFALLAHYNWSRVAIIYEQEADSSLLEQSLAAQLSAYDVLQIAVDSSAPTTYTTAIQSVLKASYNVIIMVMPEPAKVDALLTAAAQVPFILGADRQWLWVNVDRVSTAPTLLPDGAFIVNYVDADATNTTAFETDVLHAITDQTSYPETGPGSFATSPTILAFDLVNVLAQAIQQANTSSGSVTRSTLTSALRSINTWGYSGQISFDSFRTSGNVEFSVVTVNGSVPFSLYNNQLNFYSNPFSATTPVDAQTRHYPVSVLYSWALFEAFAPGAKAIVDFFLQRINTQGYLPNNVKFDLWMADNQFLPNLAAQNAFTAAQIGSITVFGDLDSAMTEVVEDVLAAYTIPLISPSATSPALSDKTQYPTFFRGIPTGQVEGAAVVALCKYWGWTEVHIISTTDAFSATLSQSVITGATLAGIKVVSTAVVSVAGTNYTDELAPFFATKPRILLNLVDPVSLYGVLVTQAVNGWAAEATVLSHSMGVWDTTIYYEAFGLPLEYLDGYVVVSVPTRNPTDPVFLEILGGLAAINPLAAFVFDVDLTMQTAWVNYQIAADAVTRCLAISCDPHDGAALMSLWASTNIETYLGDFSFTSNFDQNGWFDIMNVRNHMLENIGRFNQTTGLIDDYNMSSLIWPDGSKFVPLAVLPRTVKWLAWDDAAGIALSVLAAFGLFVGVVMLSVFVLERNSIVITSATWQFLVLMLCGAMVGFGTVFLWIGYPQPYICGLRIWLPPLAFAMILTPLMAKTWRLHKIFSLQDFKTQPIFLSTLVFIVVVLVAIQVVLCIIWISIGTLEVSIVNDINSSSIAYAVCGSNMGNKVLSYITYGYLGLLVVVTAYYAFRVRKLPRDFNESKWIGRSVYNTLLFAVLSIILGYSLTHYPTTVLIIICVCTLAICYGAIGLMMAPKLWELWRHPERRSSTNNSSGSKPKLSSTSSDGPLSPRPTTTPVRRTNFTRAPKNTSTTQTTINKNHKGRNSTTKSTASTHQDDS